MPKVAERTIKLIVAYDGFAYHGFQRQANAVTIQQILEERLETLFGHAIKTVGAARTDAGVHAYGQVVSFTTTGSIPVLRIPQAARSVLPEDIVVRDAAEVPGSFHARYSAKSKIYCYRIYNHESADPFLRRYAWHIRSALDVDSMQQALGHIIGKHDFSAFRAAGGPPVNPVREILHAQCRREAEMIECVFQGTGFLYHMVRNLVGTLVDVGHKRIAPDEVKSIRDSLDRHRAGDTAPPNGLYLKEVYYD